MATTTVAMNDFLKKYLRSVLGAGYRIDASFDFERDFLPRLDRKQLVEAIESLRSEPSWERACCLALMKQNPTPEEWLLLAASMDSGVAKRAKAHLLDHNPSEDALIYIVLSGSTTPAERKRAAELLLNAKPGATSLRHVLDRFLKGDIARRAWALLKAKRGKTSLDDLHAIICENREPTVVQEAWLAFASQKPTGTNLSYLITSCRHHQTIRNKAAAMLLNERTAEADELASIVQYCSDAKLLKAAAEKLLALDADPEHLAYIVIRVRERALAEEAWRRIARQKFTKRSWRTIDLRNIVCYAKLEHIRMEASAIAARASLDPEDRQFIVEHSPDAAVQRAFKAA